MSIAAMRDHIKELSTSNEWRSKVQNMEDRQVIAIYHSMINRMNKPKKKQELKYEQLSMFDMLENTN